MIHPSRFNKLGKALSKRFFAGDAVLVLSKIKRKSPLSEDETAFLAEIKAWFKNAMEARNWTHKEPVVSEAFARNTLILHELAVAMLRLQYRVNFRGAMDKLMSIATCLSPLQQIREQDLELLINIFTHLDRYYAERSADLLE